jgi:hypothetical protein
MLVLGNNELPSWIGGVDAASADGVVDWQNLILLVNHPASQSLGTPPIQEGSSEC